MIILVTGGRNNNDRDGARNALEPYRSVKNILVSGASTGWDTVCVRVWVTEFQLNAVLHPAPWDRMGRPAGPMRNRAMVKGHSLALYAKLVPDLVIAGWGGSGTAHCIRQAEEAGIEVIRVG